MKAECNNLVRLFSVSKRDVIKVCDYIRKQREHHSRQSYEEEYVTFLKFYQQTINPKQESDNEQN